MLRPLQGLAALRAGVRRRGWRGMAVLAASMLSDRLFDARYGLDTQTPAELASLSGTIGDLAHAQPYQATQVMALRKLLRVLDLGPDRVLVDFGSGKGRVLLVAAGRGFRAARGVEFSGGLCEIARRNIERFRRRSRHATSFEIVHGDAAEYAVRDDEDVFFLFNPFDAHVLQRVMENISRSFARHPRHMVLIYRRPVHEECITGRSPFMKVATHVFWDSDFAVFEAGRSAAR